MKDILIAITDAMPKDADGNIIDKQLHSDIINAVQSVNKNSLSHDVSDSVCDKCDGLGYIELSALSYEDCDCQEKE